MSSLIDVVSMTMRGLGCGDVARNRQAVLDVVDQALRGPADLVCLPETFTLAGLGPETCVIAEPARYTEPVPGPTTDAFAIRAREHRCYILCPILTQRDGRTYNSAVLLDRQGQVAGVYDKQNPVTVTGDYTHIEADATPGQHAGVFDLDCGPIGVRICFDATFPDAWTPLAEAGVRLVVWPSAYPGGLALRTYAFMHQFWVVSATGGLPAVVVDPCGQVVASADEGGRFFRHRLNLDYVVSHCDFNYAIPARLAEAYGERVRVSWHPAEQRMLVEPLDPAITTAQLREQFGFEPIDDYTRRHREVYRQVLAGEPLAPQTAPPGSRQQWRP